MKGWSAKVAVAKSTSHGTTERNDAAGVVMSSSAPAVTPSTVGMIRSTTWRLSSPISRRKPATPPKFDVSTPTDDVMLALRAGIPRANNVGKVSSVPPPATPLNTPAATPTASRTATRGAVRSSARSSGCMAPCYEPVPWWRAGLVSRCTVVTPNDKES